MYSQSFVGTDIADFDVPAGDPIKLMQEWLPVASDGDSARTIMSLATIGLDGYPNIRHVLASTVTSEGISFHVSSTSNKVAEIEATPRAALTIAWPEQGKQIIVQGDVAKQPELEAAKVYYQRSRYLQLLAHINTDAVAVKPAVERKTIWENFLKQNPEDGKLSPPETWLGFIVKPTRISFWRAVSDIPSNRHDYYLREDGTWRIDVVSG